MFRTYKEIAELILWIVVRFRKRREAERANKEKYSKHEVAAEPLYNVEQARKVFPFQSR
jgi:hypothetical protein